MGLILRKHLLHACHWPESKHEFAYLILTVFTINPALEKELAAIKNKKCQGILTREIPLSLGHTVLSILKLLINTYELGHTMIATFLSNSILCSVVNRQLFYLLDPLTGVLKICRSFSSVLNQTNWHVREHI